MIAERRTGPRRVWRVLRFSREAEGYPGQDTAKLVDTSVVLPWPRSRLGRAPG